MIKKSSTERGVQQSTNETNWETYLSVLVADKIRIKQLPEDV